MMMSKLIAKGIVRSYSMRYTRRSTAVAATVVDRWHCRDSILSHCDVCGGFMFNAQRYMSKGDVYFTATASITFPYELKVFDRALHELQYLHGLHPHHFTLDLNQLSRIFEYRYIQSAGCYSFPVTSIELEYMFDTLGFLWLHHSSPHYMLSLLQKQADGMSHGRWKPFDKRSDRTVSTL